MSKPITEMLSDLEKKISPTGSLEIEGCSKIKENGAIFRQEKHLAINKGIREGQSALSHNQVVVVISVQTVVLVGY